MPPFPPASALSNLADNDSWCRQIAMLLDSSIASYKTSTDDIDHLVRKNGDYVEQTQAFTDASVPPQLINVLQGMASTQHEMTATIAMFRDRITDLEKQIETVVHESRIDPLTHAHNRLAFDKDLCSLFASPSARFHLALIDIDNFKSINDRFGHPIGDKVLRFLGTILKTSGGIAYRYGGEEFVILFEQQSFEESTASLEKILEKTRKSHLIVGSDSIRITFSAGMATRHADDTAESLLKRADDAMYRAKHSGKDQVITIA